jgi:uncharacterized membrane protein (UPF0127 family)
MSHFLSEIAKTPDLPFAVRVQRTGDLVVSSCRGAFDSASRNRGLLGRDELTEQEGLLIAPCNSVHTFFMRFPIDIVFLDRGGCVLKIRQAVPAWRLAVGWRAYAVVELRAGRARDAGLQTGDVLRIDPLPAPRTKSVGYG